jgi:5-(carboxyamino)imidazole ribonucleotide mutase
LTTQIRSPEYRFGLPLRKGFNAFTLGGAVGVIMGSRSDWPFMEPCTKMLEFLEINFEFGVVSAHRTPQRMIDYAHTAEDRGLHVIIACAGGSAHLPGMTASETVLPVLAVAPKKTDQAAIGSMIEMPEGIPLSYMGGGSETYRNAGAVNAALQAAQILALHDEPLRARLGKYYENLTENVPFTCFGKED